MKHLNLSIFIIISLFVVACKPSTWHATRRAIDGATNMPKPWQVAPAVDLVKKIISHDEITKISKSAAQTLKSDPEISKIELENIVYFKLETTAKKKKNGLKLTRVEKRGLRTLSENISKEVIKNKENNNDDEEIE